MGQPVVHFELVGRDGTSLEGYLSYSEVFGCGVGAQAAKDPVAQLQDELPDDVTFYVSVRPPVPSRSCRAAEDVELAVVP